MKFLIFFSLAIGTVLAGGSEGYSYDENDPNGPSKWKLTYPDCGKNAQTPINIEKSTVSFSRKGLGIDYAKAQIKSTTIINEGYAVGIDLEFVKDCRSTLYWSGNKQTYNLRDMHLHWGPRCEGGSEHTVNGHRYAAELHLVHWNNKYKTVGDAVAQPDGLAVLGIFLELADESTYDPKLANKFIKYLKFIAQPGSNYTVTDRNEFRTIRDLIKNDVKEYYSYQGSLTTPPCYESVRWLISKEPIRIYPSELDELIKIFPKNYRPLQPLNGRKVTEYVNTRV